MTSNHWFVELKAQLRTEPVALGMSFWKITRQTEIWSELTKTIFGLSSVSVNLVVISMSQNRLLLAVFLIVYQW